MPDYKIETIQFKNFIYALITEYMQHSLIIRETKEQSGKKYWHASANHCQWLITIITPEKVFQLIITCLIYSISAGRCMLELTTCLWAVSPTAKLSRPLNQSFTQIGILTPLPMILPSSNCQNKLNSQMVRYVKSF